MNSEKEYNYDWEDYWLDMHRVGRGQPPIDEQFWKFHEACELRADEKPRSRNGQTV